MIRLGSFTLEFLPDGDDPGVGWVRLANSLGRYCLISATAAEWAEVEPIQDPALVWQPGMNSGEPDDTLKAGTR